MRSRPGFSLVLSLVVMSLILLTIITVASFVSIESRLAAQHQNLVRARLNATVSLRLALAHLQQEAGPDRRITARADIIANTTQPLWTWLNLRNPLWTGVWRSDLQLTPPCLADQRTARRNPREPIGQPPRTKRLLPFAVGALADGLRLP